MAIDELISDRGYARLTDIAKRLDITAGSCSTTLKNLKSKGFIDEDENKFMRLSEQGAVFVQIVKKNDQLLESFFMDVLGVSQKQAEIDACKMEHLLSIETSFKLAGLMKFMQSEDASVKKFMEKFAEQDPVCWKDFDVEEGA